MNLEDRLKNARLWRRCYLTFGAVCGGLTGNNLTLLIENYMQTNQVDSNNASLAFLNAVYFILFGKLYMNYYNKEQDLKEQTRKLKK